MKIWQKTFLCLLQRWWWIAPALHSYGALDVRRKNATRESTSTLKAWLYEHIKNPYPTKGEKIMLAIITKMTLTQVSTWFANARRRLKKENKMQWSPRNRTDQDDDDDDDEDKNSDDAYDVLRAGHCPDNDDVRATRTNVDECCDEIDVGGVDVGQCTLHLYSFLVLSLLVKNDVCTDFVIMRSFWVFVDLFAAGETRVTNRSSWLGLGLMRNAELEIDRISLSVVSAKTQKSTVIH